MRKPPGGGHRALPWWRQGRYTNDTSDTKNLLDSIVRIGLASDGSGVCRFSSSRDLSPEVEPVLSYLLFEGPIIPYTIVQNVDVVFDRRSKVKDGIVCRRFSFPPGFAEPVPKIRHGFGFAE